MQKPGSVGHISFLRSRSSSTRNYQVFTVEYFLQQSVSFSVKPPDQLTNFSCHCCKRGNNNTNITISFSTSDELRHPRDI